MTDVTDENTRGDESSATPTDAALDGSSSGPPRRSGHVPVLLDDVIRLLAPRPGEVYADATAGLGGHARVIAPRIDPGGTVILNDADPSNLVRAAEAVDQAIGRDVLGGVDPSVGVNKRRVETFSGNFADLPRKLAERNRCVDMLLADLGFSSNQVDDASRGLSFSRDGPLDMRMDPSLPVTAAELVASLTERELAETIQMYGEEREATRIARKLVRARQSSPITTTGQLAAIVRSALPRRFDPNSIDPATRTFQALRIAVNDEMGSLNALLSSIERAAKSVRSGGRSWLSAGARVAIITFHSLEDRPVKRSFAGLISEGSAEDLSDGPVGAGADETAANPRSRSAKLRVIRLAGGSTVGGGPV